MKTFTLDQRQWKHPQILKLVDKSKYLQKLTVDKDLRNHSDFIQSVEFQHPLEFDTRKVESTLLKIVDKPTNHLLYGDQDILVYLCEYLALLDLENEILQLFISEYYNNELLKYTVAYLNRQRQLRIENKPFDNQRETQTFTLIDLTCRLLNLTYVNFKALSLNRKKVNLNDKSAVKNICTIYGNPLRRLASRYLVKYYYEEILGKKYDRLRIARTPDSNYCYHCLGNITEDTPEAQTTKCCKARLHKVCFEATKNDYLCQRCGTLKHYESLTDLIEFSTLDSKLLMRKYNVLENLRDSYSV